MLSPTVALAFGHAQITPRTALRVETPRRALPIRPRTITSPEHAGAVLRLAPTIPEVLPRWGIRSPIRDEGAQPGQYAGTIGWTSRDHYLRWIIPAAIALHRHVLGRHKISAATFLRWANAKTLYAQQRRCGRTVIVRPVTLAGILQCTTRTVQRCNAAAREMGLERVITPGRMLTWTERRHAMDAGSPQRGLATVTCFVSPRDLAVAASQITHHPGTGSPLPRGTVFDPSVTDFITFKARKRRKTSPSLRSGPHQRKRGPAWHLAADLTARVFWLRGVPAGRLQGQLTRFTGTEHPWTAERLLRAMDNINLRLGYSSPVRANSRPWGLLAWYLRQIDPVMDHPHAHRGEPRNTTAPSPTRPADNPHAHITAARAAIRHARQGAKE